MRKEAEEVRAAIKLNLTDIDALHCGSAFLLWSKGGERNDVGSDGYWDELMPIASGENGRTRSKNKKDSVVFKDDTHRRRDARTNRNH